MSDTKKLIEAELSQAGMPSFITPEMMKLDALRITSETQIENTEFLCRLNGKPCLPRKDLTCITGQAKSGKTIAISMLMACMTKPGEDRRVIGLERISDTPLKVMWIDNEQSPQSTKDILVNRVGHLCGSDRLPDELLYVFNLRSVMVSERYNLLSDAVMTYRPDVVIIDNVRDMIKDINDGVKAQELIEGLMRIAEEFNCNITIVLHLNRNSDNRGLRGWLGTEVMNKVFEVYVCEKLTGVAGEKPYFKIWQLHTRKYDMDTPMKYELTDDGIPVAFQRALPSKPEAEPQFSSYGKADVNSLNRDYIIVNGPGSKNAWEWNLRKVFSDAIGDRATIGFQELKNTVMSLTHIKSSPYCEKVFAMAEKARVIRRDQDRCGRIVVMLLPLLGTPPSL